MPCSDALKMYLGERFCPGFGGFLIRDRKSSRVLGCRLPHLGRRAHLARRIRDPGPAGLADMRSWRPRTRHAARIKKPPNPGQNPPDGRPCPAAAVHAQSTADRGRIRCGLAAAGHDPQGCKPAGTAASQGRPPDRRTPSPPDRGPYRAGCRSTIIHGFVRRFSMLYGSCGSASVIPARPNSLISVLPL